MTAEAGPERGTPPPPTPIGWQLAVVALVAGVAALVGLPGRATHGARVSGDEPQYLLTATSLAEDGDLDIADELAVAAYLDYHEVPLDPQSAVLADGRRLSPHDPLLPLILAGPMAAAGWVGAKATLAALGAATAALTAWLAVRRFAVAPGTAALVTGGTFAGIPLAAYGSQVYPEMPAALALAGSVAAVTAPPSARWPLVAAPAAVVALPWLSVKYVPLAALVAVALLWRLRARPVAGMVSMVVVVGAGLGYLVFHQRVYGGWTVYAAGDHFAERGEFAVTGTEIDVLGRSRRLVGLAVDGVFGLVVWSPLWALAPPALGRAARRWRGPEGVALGLVALTWFTASFVALTMHGWWVPGRQLVVGLPLAAILVAAWVDDSGRRVRAAVVLGALGAVNWVWLAVEASTGRRTLIVDFFDTSAPPFRLLSPLLPDGMRSGPLDDVLLAAWGVVVGAALVVGARRPGAIRPAPVLRWPPPGLSRSAAAARPVADRRPGWPRGGSGPPPRRDGARPPDR